MTERINNIDLRNISLALLSTHLEIFKTICVYPNLNVLSKSISFHLNILAYSSSFYQPEVVLKLMITIIDVCSMSYGFFL